MHPLVLHSIVEKPETDRTRVDQKCNQMTTAGRGEGVRQACLHVVAGGQLAISLGFFV